MIKDTEYQIVKVKKNILMKPQQVLVPFSSSN